MPNHVPHDGIYTPPWSVTDCQTFPGRFAITDTKTRAVAIGLTKEMAEDWKHQLETNGFIDHED